MGNVNLAAEQLLLQADVAEPPAPRSPPPVAAPAPAPVRQSSAAAFPATVGRGGPAAADGWGVPGVPPRQGTMGQTGFGLGDLWGSGTGLGAAPAAAGGGYQSGLPAMTPDELSEMLSRLDGSSGVEDPW